MNSPDTQPGWYNVYLKPHEGKTYINLLYKDDGSEESIYQELSKTLLAENCFMIEIYLAQMCQDSLHGLDPYKLNHPGRLTIRGSENYSCEEGQILAVFDVVDNCEWESYKAIFKADADINYIYLEFTRGDQEYSHGSILIDDFTLEYSKPLNDQVMEVDYGNEATITATYPGMNYNWEYEEVTLVDDSSTIFLPVDHNFKVDVSYFSENGCLIFESILIYVNPLVPNVLTSSSPDYLNDVFEIKGLVESTELRVMNRWGQEVYYNSHYRNTWLPEGLSPGVYYYSLFLKDTQRQKIGTLYLF